MERRLPYIDSSDQIRRTLPLPRRRRCPTPPSPFRLPALPLSLATSKSAWTLRCRVPSYGTAPVLHLPFAACLDLAK